MHLRKSPLCSVVRSASGSRGQPSTDNVEPFAINTQIPANKHIHLFASKYRFSPERSSPANKTLSLMILQAFHRPLPKCRNYQITSLAGRLPTHPDTGSVLCTILSRRATSRRGTPVTSDRRMGIYGRAISSCCASPVRGTPRNVRFPISPHPSRPLTY